MKIFKIIITTLAFVVTIAIVAALILPKDVQIERSLAINAPVTDIFKRVSHLKELNVWSPWQEYDPEMTKEYKGTDGEIGAQYHWSGNDSVGTGYQEIVAITPYKRVDIKLVFTAPWKTQSDIYYVLTRIDSAQTSVMWGYKTKAPFPQNLVYKLTGMEDILSEEFDKGLQKLKSLSEGL